MARPRFMGEGLINKMNINKEYRRCKRAWQRITKKYFSITDDKDRITYEYFGRGKNVQTWREYTDFDDFYICYYRDSEGVAFYELYKNGCDERITHDKSIDGIKNDVKYKIEQLSLCFNTLQQVLTANDDYIYLTISDGTKIRARRA